MKQETFTLLENYMLSCMGDSAHDSQHIYRVLYAALNIAKTEENVDYDVLICACLLHDIGRKEQFENPSLCHAQVGAKKAYLFLKEQGFSEEFAVQVRDCIRTHRFRQNDPPKSREAKILFDADKLDVTGAVGIARTLVYKGSLSEPLYSLAPDGSISDGTGDEAPSFFQEYKYKLEHLQEHFYTERGRLLAAQRQAAAAAFYESMLQEVRETCSNGKELLDKQLK